MSTFSSLSRTICWLGVCSLTLLSACKKDDPQPSPEPIAPEKNRTVLFYMMDDHNLWNVMETTLNQLEAGWNEEIDGNLLVYLDPSPHLTQFSSPVLLKIVHDETDAICSEVVKTYPEQDPVDNTVMKGVLEDAITLFPAQSHGLIIGTHGSAWFPGNLDELIDIPDMGHDEDDHAESQSLALPQNQTKALGGGERYGTCLEVKDLAQLLPIKYDFLIFHACLMGNVETAYELREKCSLMVGCMQPLPGPGYPYDEIIQYLYTKPQADLYHFTEKSAQWYDALPAEATVNFDVSVIRTDRLDALASATHTLMEKFAADPDSYYDNLSGNLLFIDEDLPLCDLNQAIGMGCNDNPSLEQDYQNFVDALSAAIPQQWSVTRVQNPNLASPEEFCGLSGYIPMRDPRVTRLNEFYQTNYSWATAAGFNLLNNAQ